MKIYHRERIAGQKRSKRNSAVVAVSALLAACGLMTLYGPSAGLADIGPDTRVDGKKSSSVIQGHYVVVLKDSVEHPGAAAVRATDRLGGKVEFVYRHALKGYSASLTEAEASAIERNPNVKYVTPDHRVHLLSQTIPTGIERTFAPTDESLDIDGVDDVRIDADVAVLDTGIDASHPDLNVYKRVNCVPLSENPELEECIENSGVDKVGHGTHVAGTIGAIDNGFGVVGMAPGVRLWALRIFNGQGNGAESWALAAMDWMTAHSSQIEVANMSFGCFCPLPALEEAVEEAVDAGIVAVVAAGNDGSDADEFSPAKVSDAITVSALADSDGKPSGKGPGSCYNDSWGSEQSLVDDELASFSNWGNVIDIAAPGVCILSTVPLGGSELSSSPTAEYATASGTSMAAPHVAGAAATLASVSNPEDQEDVEAIQEELLGKGSFDWTDKSLDAMFEPLLYLGPPTKAVVATGVSEIDSEGHATIHGVVNPGGINTSYQFEYGPTTAYGSVTPVQPQALGAGNTNLSVSQALSGLTGEYHFRVVAIHGSEKSYSSDRSFTVPMWTPVAVPKPASRYNPELYDVSCVTVDWCMAVGQSRYFESYNGLPKEHREALAVKWSGESWQVVPVPTQSDMMLGVSCASTSFCVAVGVGGAAMKWDGSQWSVTSLAVPSEKLGGWRLNGVSCTSAVACVVVGEAYVNDPLSEWSPFIEHWNGSKWIIRSAPDPSWHVPTETLALEDVSCSSSSYCMATGWGFSGEERHFLTYEWNGTTWSLGISPETTFDWDKPETVSCVAPNFCMLSGYSTQPDWKSGKPWEYERFWARWDGSKWTKTQIAQLISDMACTAPNWCVAIGVVNEKLWGAHWNGVGWTESVPVQSPDRHLQWLEGVACPSAAGCRAVGWHWTNGGNPGGQETEPIAEHIGKTWPTAETQAAVVTGKVNAALKATVNPQGSSTTYRFEYGTSTNYGHEWPVGEESIGSGSSDMQVSNSPPNLVAATTYHFRVVATNKYGTTYGGDRSFSTASAVVLCKSNESPCASVNRHQAGAEVQAALKGGTTLKVSDTNGNVLSSCSTATLSGTIANPGSNEAAAATVEYSKAGIGECTAVMVAEGLTWQASINSPDGSGSGTVTIANMKLKLSIFGTTCVYGASPTFKFKGGSQAEMTVESAAFAKLSGGFLCPSSAKLNAAYVISSPGPLFVVTSAASPGTLCKVNEELCSEGNRYQAGTSIQAGLKAGTAFKITESSGNLIASCESSTLQGKITAPGGSGSAGAAEITSLGFSQCAQSMNAEGLTWQTSIDSPDGSGSGTVTIANMKLKLSAFGTTCVYGGSPTLKLKGGSQAEMTAESAALSKVSGGFLCPGSVKLNAAYAASSPGSLFVTS